MFALYIEPLAQMIRQEDVITGIDINDQNHTISLFADDFLIILKDPVNLFMKHAHFRTFWRTLRLQIKHISNSNSHVLLLSK